MHQYDIIFDWHVKNRRPHIGVPEVAAFTQSLPPKSKILDLGCGDGVPIAKFLIESGFDVFGIDSSERMIEAFCANFPSAPAERATIQKSEFFNQLFDAVVAWGVLFYLTEIDQDTVIGNVSRHLNAGGRFLFTSGDKRIVSETTMQGVTFPYCSLGPDVYRSMLESHGLKLIDQYSDKWQNTYYVSERR